MGYLFTSESVSEGHPDKVADQISDAVLDKLLAYDPSSKVACETLVTTGQVVLAGEVKTKAYVDLQLIAREVIQKIGYTKGEYMFESNSCGVLSAIHEQSPDINRGVERQDPMEQGAGDQGMMFGYATNETENYMPLSLDLAHRILQVLADIRREGKEMTYLRPDAKSQVTIEYDDNGTPVRIDTIVVSTQHDDFIQPADDSEAAQLKADEEMLATIRQDVINILTHSGKHFFIRFQLGSFAVVGRLDEIIMLGRNYNCIDTDRRTVIIVFNSYLTLGVRTEISHLFTFATDVGQHLQDAMCQVERKRHVVFCFV